MKPIVVAITGASGSIYAVRLLQVLLSAGKTVHLTISPAAVQVLKTELDLNLDLKNFETSQLLPNGLDMGEIGPSTNAAADAMSSAIFKDSSITSGSLTYHHFQDFTAGIASGSFLTSGMVICPCSMGTLGGLANGLSSNLIHRAADVHLKERRKLVLVPRETPLGSIQLENMKKLADTGAVILPAMPGFYHNPLTIHDLVDFVVARICDHLDVDHKLFERWGS